MLHKIMSGAAVALLCAAANAASAQPQYQITTLGAPDGALESRATAINSAGHVAGWALFPNNVGKPVVWIDGEMTVLPVPDSHPGATATDISDTGVVCGNAWSNGSFGFATALMWPSLDDALVLLPTLGGPYSGAYGISPDGEIITGWSYPPNTQISLKAFRYHTKTGTIDDLGLLPATSVMSASGVAINSHHQILANGNGGVLSYRSVIVDPVEGSFDIGTFGSWETRPEDISDAGHVVGWGQPGPLDQDNVEGVMKHAFLWHKGRMTDLGTLDGFIESRAYGVNSSGIVVGTCFNQPFNSPRRAYVWSDGTMTDLTALIPPDAGWVLEQAEAINDSGQIAGWGLLNGQRRAFLLTPQR